MKVITPTHGWKSFWRTWDGWIDLFVAIFGALSVLSLLTVSLELSLIGLLERLVGLYDEVVNRVFLPIDDVLLLISQTLQLQLRIPETWKNVFVLMAIYIFRHAANIYKQAEGEASIPFSTRLHITVAFQVLVGITLCTISTIFLGFLDSSDRGAWLQVGYVFALIFSILLYDMAYVVWHALVLLPQYNLKFGREAKERTS